MIYESQTACKSSHRRRALKKLGKCYDCACNPEIMSAFIYALNDSDKRVRKTAADEIGDQLKENSCCCTQCTVDALTYALADCERSVSKRAEKALERCGYDVVDPNCRRGGRGNGCPSTSCTSTGCASNVNEYSPAAPTVAPGPPAESKADLPKRNKEEKVRVVSAAKKGLSNLFGLVR
jgi:HEAT repeats